MPQGEDLSCRALALREPAILWNVSMAQCSHRGGTLTWPPAHAESLVKDSILPIPDSGIWAEMQSLRAVEVRVGVGMGPGFLLFSIQFLSLCVLFSSRLPFLPTNSHFLSTIPGVVPGAVKCFIVMLDQADDDN